MEEEEEDRHEKGRKVKKRLTLRPSEFRAVHYFLFYVFNVWLLLIVVILFCFYSIGFRLRVFLSVCLSFDAL